MESEQTDREAREEANDLFDKFANWLDQNSHILTDRMSNSTALGGSWIIPARVFDYEHGDLLFVLAPPNGKQKGAFGHAGVKPLIVLYALKGPNDLQYIDTRISGMRDVFVHEFTHYMAWRTNKRPKVSSADLLGDDTDRTAYYNHAEELNAYYQEGATSFYRLVKNIIKLGHLETAKEMWGDKSTAELTSIIVKKEFPLEFVDHLTPGNRRKIEKRVARFIEQSIRPLFDMAEPVAA